MKYTGTTLLEQIQKEHIKKLVARKDAIIADALRDFLGEEVMDNSGTIPISFAARCDCLVDGETKKETLRVDGKPFIEFMPPEVSVSEGDGNQTLLKHDQKYRRLF